MKKLKQQEEPTPKQVVTTLRQGCLVVQQQAADLIERLLGENEELRKKLESKTQKG